MQIRFKFESFCSQVFTINPFNITVMQLNRILSVTTSKIKLIAQGLWLRKFQKAGFTNYNTDQFWRGSLWCLDWVTFVLSDRWHLSQSHSSTYKIMDLRVTVPVRLLRLLMIMRSEKVHIHHWSFLLCTKYISRVIHKLKAPFTVTLNWNLIVAVAL